MITKTFEQAFKSKLETQLKTYITDKNVEVTNDIKFKSLYKNSNSVVVVIASGGGNKQSVSDLTDYSMNVTFMCDVNYLQDLMLAINRFIDDKSGLYDTMTIAQTGSGTDKVYAYQILWSTPITSSTPMDIRVDKNKDVMKVVMVNIIGHTYFSSEVMLGPLSFKVKINGSTIVPLDYVVYYDCADAPTFKPFVIFGYAKPIQVRISDAKIWNISCLKTTTIKTGVHDAAITTIDLSTDNGVSWIPISAWSISEKFENRILLSTFTLTVGNSGTIDDTTSGGSGSGSNPGGLIEL